jgi:crotonobetaine/carnitine-CoA ligase
VIPDTDDGFLTLFLARAVAEPEQVFARIDGSALTFGALERMSAGVAAGLARRRVGPGSRVAAMLRNGRLPLALIYALARLGAVWVPLNAQARGASLRHVIEHAEPSLLLAEADLRQVVDESGADLAGVPLLVADAAEVQGWLAATDRFESDGAPADAPFGILYTSGTTGRPKGVIVTHRMLRLAGEAVAIVSGVADGDVMLVWEPLYHIGGAQLIVVPLLRRVALACVPRFSASRFWHDAAAAGATHIHYLGGVLQMLMRQPPGPHERAHRVRVAWGAGCPASDWRAIEARFGLALRECYGMTEASSITTWNADGTPGAIGRPLAWFSVTLRDAEGREARRGEIVVRTSLPGALFPGYFRDPEATAAALRDGALHTGDLGAWDDAGNLVYAGRLADSVRCRGENVSAWEVEHVAAAHPAIEACAMTGVAAEIGEQDIKLFVQRRPGAALTAPELSRWLAGRLAPYQAPRYIAFVDSFPRTPSERIAKHALPSGRDDCWDRFADPPRSGDETDAAG